MTKKVKTKLCRSISNFKKKLKKIQNFKININKTKLVSLLPELYEQLQIGYNLAPILRFLGGEMVYYTPLCTINIQIITSKLLEKKLTEKGH